MELELLPEYVTGYIGQIIDECEVDNKALVLLEELYGIALEIIDCETFPDMEIRRE